MKNYKYTTDGRKVVVIGDLNQTEKIVQEIFVTEDGDEIPSGERFVAKSLLDTPALSWKATALLKAEAEYDKESREWERKLNLLRQQKSLAYDALEARVKWLNQVAKQPHPQALTKVVETLSFFLSEKEKWVLVGTPSSFELVEFKEDEINALMDRTENTYSRKRFDAMRLVSIYGKSDGDFEYIINDYSDGSGGGKNVMFFKSKREALKYMQKEFDELKEYNYLHLISARKHGLILEEGKLDKYYKERRVIIEKDIESLKKNLQAREAELKDYETVIVSPLPK